MVKRTIIAIIGIVAIVLVVAVIVNAYSVGYSRYGPVYSNGYPFYMYYPIYYGPSPGVYYPYNYYYYPEQLYPYYYPTDIKQDSAKPSVSYPYYSPGVVARSALNQQCGIVNSVQLGCDYGLVCDYTKTDKQGVGVCTVASNYPFYS